MQRAGQLVELTKLAAGETDPGAPAGLTPNWTRTYTGLGAGADETHIFRGYDDPSATQFPIPEPPPAGWSPTDEASLIAWYDATDAATITEIAGAVSQWNDKSGNDYHLTQSLADRRPVISAAAINGQNALSFVGDQTPSTNNDAIGRDNTPFPSSFQIVYAIQAATFPDRTWLRLGGTSRYLGAGLAGHILRSGMFGTGNDEEWLATDQPAGLYIIRIVFDLVAGHHKGYLNGELKYTKAGGYETAINTGSDSLAIGAAAFSSAESPFTGLFADLEIYSDITDTVGQKAEGRLAHLLGKALVAGHPYENEAP